MNRKINWASYEKQIIDAGDGTNVKSVYQFADVLSLLHNCSGKWECKIVHPEYITIGCLPEDSLSADDQKAHPGKPKKSFWKKIFGK